MLIRHATLLAVLACFSCDTAPRQVILASTTSTEDSGLFEVLLPAFHSAHPGHAVKVIAVGSGQALALGRRGDADVLLVHSPADERSFMQQGHGRRRLPVMTNDYLMVGPPGDPAGARAGPDAVGSMRRIASAAASGVPSIRWASRGDSSGTHRRELTLWTRAGVEPRGAWYLDVGQGMGETLMVAAGRGAYTLTDAASFMAMRKTLDLDVINSGGEALLNEYSVITVTDARNEAGADMFADWIVSSAAQALIGGFRTDGSDTPLFNSLPAAR